MFRRFRLAIIMAVLWTCQGIGIAQEQEIGPPTRSTHYQKQLFKAKDGTVLNYWLMKPAQIEEGKKYPLVLALHGRGGNTTAAGTLGSDELRKKYPCFVMAPATDRQAVWAVPNDFNKLQGKALISVVLEALEKLRVDYPVDASRVYVTGQSMGGFGSFGAVAASPQTFAAAIPVCGGWSSADAAKFKSIPVWVFHGDADTTVPVERSRQMVEAIKQAGGSPKYTEYPGVGHNSWTKAYAAPETWDWLFAQQRRPN